MSASCRTEIVWLIDRQQYEILKLRKSSDKQCDGLDSKSDALVAVCYK